MGEIRASRSSAALVFIMRERSMSIRQLSEATGIPYRTLINYTSGRRDFLSISAESYLRICNALNVSPHTLSGQYNLEIYLDILEEAERESRRIVSEKEAQEREELLEIMRKYPEVTHIKSKRKK